MAYITDLIKIPFELIDISKGIGSAPPSRFSRFIKPDDVLNIIDKVVLFFLVFYCVEDVTSKWD